MSKNSPLRLVALLIACVLAYLVVESLSRHEEDFAELALGKETQTLMARVDGHSIHCSGIDDADECFKGWKARGSRPLTLWLGNSQLHAINQLRPGDHTAPAVAHRLLSSQGRDLLAFSQPNASLQEHYVLFHHLLDRATPEHLLLPMVFDDTRETGLRPDIQTALTNPAVAVALEATPTGAQLLAEYSGAPLDDLAALDRTTQEASERALNDWLTSHSRIWAHRPTARGHVFSWLYRTRNKIFGITAQSKRRAIPARLRLNLAAARSLLSAARDRDIDVLVYIAPLRSDVARPYVVSEYDSFKNEVTEMARQEGATFLDLESLVPGELWGTTEPLRLGGDAELDFMHFQGGGHALLADAILEYLSSDGEGRSS